MSVRMGVLALFFAIGCLGQSGFLRGQEAPDENAETRFPELSGKVSRVTLFRDTAIVTREVEVEPGVEQFIVTGLPDQIIPGSLFAESNDLSVRCVRLKRTPIEGSTSKVIQQIDAELAEIKKEDGVLEARIAVLQHDWEAVESMVKLGNAAASKELEAGSLKPEAWLAVIDGASERRIKLSEALLEQEGQRAEISSRKTQLERERTELTGRVPGFRYDAIVFLQPKVVDELGGDEAEAEVEVRYRVAQCGWEPRYTAAADSKEQEVEIRYGASVTQTTGEDWASIQLTLSTASPDLDAAPPKLTPLRVIAENEADSGPFGDDDANAPASQDELAYGRKMEMIQQNQRMFEQNLGRKVSKLDRSRDVTLNQFGGELQSLEFEVDRKAAKQLIADADQELASQTYVLEQPVTLESRGDTQLVSIANVSFDGDPIHVCTPLLSSFAYRQVSVVNGTDMTLLRGPATVYLDERFVGITDLPSTASGQALTIGLGADDQVRTRRELLEKEQTIQGGNQRIRFGYRLVINNFKGQEVAVRVLDRVPHPRESSDIVVSMGKTSHQISDDALYLRTRRPEGILRFDVTAGADSKGSEAMDVTYEYTLELARTKQVAVPDVDSQAQLDMNQADFFGGGGLGGSAGGMGGGGSF
ncbi:MAG: mucoidy inhibitor MuiA family protein [Planctomycetota bacterium]